MARCTVTSIAGRRCLLDAGHQRDPLHDYDSHDYESVTAIIAERDAARVELADLHASIARKDPAAGFFLAAYQAANRTIAELRVVVETRAVHVRELEAELAKERERTAGMLGVAAGVDRVIAILERAAGEVVDKTCAPDVRPMFLSVCMRVAARAAVDIAGPLGAAPSPQPTIAPQDRGRPTRVPLADAAAGPEGARPVRVRRPAAAGARRTGSQAGAVPARQAAHGQGPARAGAARSAGR